MPATVLTAIAFVDTDGGAISLDAEDWFEKLLVQFFDLLLRSDLFLLGRLWLLDNSLLFLDGIFHLTVLLVHRIGEILDAEHIAMVGEGEAIHAVFLAFGHQVGHLRHAVEHGIVRVDVQMREVLRDIIAHFWLFLPYFLLVKVRLHLDASGLYHIGVGGLEVFDELGIDMQVGLIQHATTDQFEEDAGRGLHVGTCVMSRIEILAKQQVMELS